MTDPIPHAIAERPNARKHRVSLLWLLPIMAFVLGLTVVAKTVEDADIPITLRLNSGAGIVAGKTVVRHQGIDIGVVSDIRLATEDDVTENRAPKVHGVVATIQMKKNTHPYLNNGSEFWVVKPEVNLQGVSGLDTLVSGNYIAMKMGRGKRQRNFTALTKPPRMIDIRNGLLLKLRADDLGSLHLGSPVSYRKLQVGEVVDYQLTDDNLGVDIIVRIEKEHKHLVNTHSRFWNSSGIRVDGSLSSIRLHMDSIASLVAGGIAFDTPEEKDAGLPVDNHQEFHLYEDFDSAQTGVTIFIHMPTAQGISKGHTAIRYRGLEAGKVHNIRPKEDLSGVIIEAILDPKAEHALNETTLFWLVAPSISWQKISGISTLITGAYIEMDFQQGTAPQRQFVALDHPPAPDANTPGLHLVLTADTLGSLHEGSQILYKRISIGSVQEFKLSKDGESVEISIHIAPEYTHLIQPKTRFFQASGLKVEADLTGVSVKTASLQSLLAGGIEITAPTLSTAKNNAVKNNDRFPLYEDQDAAENKGPHIRVRWTTAEDLRVGSKVVFQGVAIGEVTNIALDKQLEGIWADIQLEASMKRFAQQGALFWVASPQLGLTHTDNLGSVVTGANIEAFPGTGTFRKEFIGLDYIPRHLPALSSPSGDLNIVLLSTELDDLTVDTPVTYRQVPIGRVTGFDLTSDARHVAINIVIQKRYAELIRENTVFWSLSGVDFDWNLWKGVKFKLDTTESILTGAIALAVPDKLPLAPTVESGHRFGLSLEEQKGWRDWQPPIDLRP